MLREITEIASGHTTNKYKGWDSNSSVRDLLQSRDFPTEQHNIQLQRATLSVPTPSKETEYINSLTKNFLHDVNICIMMSRFLNDAY